MRLEGDEMEIKRRKRIILYCIYLFIYLIIDLLLSIHTHNWSFVVIINILFIHLMWIIYLYLCGLSTIYYLFEDCELSTSLLFIIYFRLSSELLFYYYIHVCIYIFLFR
jgi:hypothetical protein